MQKKAEIDAMLARLQALSDDHFGYSPDDVTWDHVGTLGDYAELLKRITDKPSRKASTPPSRVGSPAPPRAAPAAGARGR